MVRSLFYLCCICGLLVFDAAQQYYYLHTFKLVPEGQIISFATLLQNHLYRWGVFWIVHTPLFIYLNNQIKVGLLPAVSSVKTVIFVIGSLVFSLFLISISSLLFGGSVLSIETLLETSIFMFFQKGLTFLMVSMSMLLLMLNYHRKSVMNSQLVEITELKSITNTLKGALENEGETQLHVKIGQKVHAISIEEIVWIQSDNYCVKIHTETRSFTFRESLKSLSEKLAPYGFVRVHRSALFNKKFLDQINYQDATLRLKDHSEIPISRSGIKVLKEMVLN